MYYESGPICHMPPDFAFLPDGAVVTAYFVLHVLGKEPNIIRDGGGWDTLPHRKAHDDLDEARLNLAEFVESSQVLSGDVKREVVSLAVSVESCDFGVAETNHRLDREIRRGHGRIVPAHEYVTLAKNQISGRFRL